MMDKNKRIALILVVGILLVGNVFFAFKYFFASEDLKNFEATGAKVEMNNKVIDFTSMFIKKVLQAEGEVDFETRLSLENAVRDLKDEEVLEEWQNFIGSKTEADAQDSVKRLLGILITKIQK